MPTTDDPAARPDPRITELMRVLESVLIEVEPLRYEQRADIDRACVAKREWADHHNATCGNSNEMWFYMTEYRRSLETAIEPLSAAVREANRVFDEISAHLAAEIKTEANR